MKYPTGVEARETTNGTLPLRRKVMKHILFVAILLAAVSVPVWGHADTDGIIGVVRNVAGSATVTRGGNVLPATTGTLSLIHISEPTRLGMISYAVFCLKK